MAQQQTTVSFSITIASAPLTVTSPPPPGGQVGVAYSHQFTASGGVAPYVWSLTGGTLPPGLTLDAAGLLSGIPATGGTYANIQVTVTDSGT